MQIDGVVHEQGHMYLFEHYVCFYSNILGYEKKVCSLSELTLLLMIPFSGSLDFLSS